MDLNSPDALAEALRDSGLYAPHLLAELPAIVDTTRGDPAALADRLLARKLLTGYQSRKVRVNRSFELIVGQYLILDKIGEGGMGKVYKAVQLRTGRVVALKIVRSSLTSNKTVMRRYKREAAAAAALNHPNIVSLFDADEANGRHYLAMEYVEGSDLSRLVKEFGPLPYPEACEYIRQAALGLQHAHDAGLIHRDIKPSNMLVCGERALPGTSGVANVRILDMGLVRSLFEDEDESRTEVTRDGTVVGTPDYMSPEQAKNSSTVDTRADLYSLGCTLYMLVVGRPPFPDGTPIDKLLRHQLDAPPELRKKVPGVPSGLSALVAKLLAKKPNDRYQSAQELATALEPYTAESPPEAPRRKSARSRKPVPDGSTVVTTTVAPPALRRVAARAVGDEATPSAAMPRPAVAVGGPKSLPSESSSPSMPATDTPSGSSRTPKSRRTKPRAKKHRNAGIPTWAIAAGSAFVVLAVGLIVGALVAKSSNDPNRSTAKTATGPGGSPHNIGANSGPSLPPAAVNLPDNTIACLVIYPQPYIKRSSYEISSHPRYVGVLNMLTEAYRFDPRKFNRATIAFPAGKNNPFVATGEGSFANADWANSLDATPGFIGRNQDGLKYYECPPTAKDSSIFGGVLGDRGFALANQKESLLSVVRRAGTKRLPVGLSPGLREALPDVGDPSPPLATFVADGQWTPPGTESLAQKGIQLVVTRIRIVDNSFEVEVTLLGQSPEKLRDFVSLTLTHIFDDVFPLLRPFMMPLVQPDRWQFDAQSGLTRMRLGGHWEANEFHEWLEAFLPPVK